MRIKYQKTHGGEEMKMTHWFWPVCIMFHIEDRGEAIEENSRYKHFVQVYVMKRRVFSITFRNYIPVSIYNDEGMIPPPKTITAE